jgi:hypothetical protein
MDFAAWLRSLGLERYEAIFRENAIDETVLPDLTDQDLEKLGVLLGHRRKLLHAIANLKTIEKGAPAVAAVVGSAAPVPLAQDTQGKVRRPPVSPNTSFDKETPIDFERKSGAVTAAGVALILLALHAIRPFTNINPALPSETHFKLIPVYAVFLASFLIFAFAAAATVLRWKRWRIWAGAAAWLAILLAFRSTQSITLTSRFTRINPEQLIVSLLMLAIAVFVLWVWNQERKTAATNAKPEVTVAGITLVFLGIYFWLPILNLVLFGNPPGLSFLFFFFAICLIFVFAGLAMILRWGGWRIWAGTVSWLTIVILVVGVGSDTYTTRSIDFYKLTLFTAAILVCVFVLWAKRQDKALALQPTSAVE